MDTISHPRDRAELVPDDNVGLREQLDALTKQRITALEVLDVNRVGDSWTVARREMRTCKGRPRAGHRSREGTGKTPEPKTVDRDLGL